MSVHYDGCKSPKRPKRPLVRLTAWSQAGPSGRAYWQGRAGWGVPRALAFLLASAVALVLMAGRLSSLSQRHPLHRQALEQVEDSTAEPALGPDAAPRVALLFLSRGPLPLERMWREFFATAAEIEAVRWPHQEQWAAQIAAAKEAASRRGGAAAAAVAAAISLPAAEARRRRTLRSYSSNSGLSGAAAMADLVALAAERLEQQQQQHGRAAVAGHNGQHTARVLVHLGQQQEQQPEPLAGEMPEGTLAGEGFQVAGDAGNVGVADAGAAAAAAATVVAGERLPGILELLEGDRQEGGGVAGAEQEILMSQRDPEGIIARQSLFNVYVHTAPHYRLSSRSIFAGYQIADRVLVQWGQFSMVEAERRLLAAALADPRNVRMVLLSESCAPLYPPHVVYMQLLHDTQSRVNACGKRNAVVDRWMPQMYQPGLLNPFSWRKSSQWKTLLREHAELVVADDRVWRPFYDECYTFIEGQVPLPAHVVGTNTSELPDRSCVPDEHYIPTLLAVHHRDNETTCFEALTHTEWIPGGWSPRSHSAREVNRTLIARLRQQAYSPQPCSWQETLGSVHGMVRRKGEQGTLSGTASDFWPLEPRCFLFARKFAPSAQPWLVVLSRDCETGTAIHHTCLPGGAAAADGSPAA